MSNLAKMLKNYLEFYHISQEKLAKTIGVSQVIVGAWCNGNRIPSGENIIKLSLATDLKEEELIKAYFDDIKEQLSKTETGE